MPRKILFCLFVTGTTTLFIIAAVSAGGWAVITLDELPEQLVAGEPLTVGFMVRQHGRSPMGGLTPKITARNLDTGDSIIVEAAPVGEIGHYSATFALPEAGRWQWSISAFTMDQVMPELSVIAVSGTDRHAGFKSLPPLIVGGIAGVLALAAAWIVFRPRRTGWIIALVAAGLIFAGTGWALAANIQTDLSRTPESGPI